VILADLQVKDQAEEQQVEEAAKDKNSLLHHSSFFDNLNYTPTNTQIILTVMYQQSYWIIYDNQSNMNSFK
jgi:hypothetical protein